MKLLQPDMPGRRKSGHRPYPPPLDAITVWFFFFCFVLFCFSLGAFPACSLRSLLFSIFSLAYSWGSSRITSLRCRLMFCFLLIYLKDLYLAWGIGSWRAFSFLCNFPNCVVTTSSLPLRLVYVSENNNNNNSNDQ